MKLLSSIDMVMMYLLLILPLCMVHCQVVEQTMWAVHFLPDSLPELLMYNTVEVNFSTKDLTEDDIQFGQVRWSSEHPDIAESQIQQPILLRMQNISSGLWMSTFNVTGNFIGHTDIKMVLEGNRTRVSTPLKVTVIRQERTIDHAFVFSVIILMSIIFINFGCALDCPLLCQSLRKPVGPTIGVFTHFIIMPLLSYVIGIVLFYDSPAMRLGLFFTGISPAGGASNIWTVTLGGNLNLSITMTAISTLFSFFMIPLWAFTLGQEIFSSGQMVVPYSRIAESAVGMAVPIAIGVSIQHCWPSLSRLLVRFLKPFSTLLILGIIIFATVTNWYLFRLFTWQIMLGGMLLPLLGYIIGAVLARLLQQPPADVLAISIETGIQNTGIAIFMLQFCLGQPAADLTSVVPVAVAVMSPLPLLTLYTLQRILGSMMSASSTSPLLQSPVNPAGV